MARWGHSDEPRLVVGPANAGKVALLLERYLARLDDEPFLIVPNRADVDRVERDLLARCGCLLGGSIGTFDDLFERIAAATRARRPVARGAQRALVARRAVASAARERRIAAGSARFAGFADSLLRRSRRARGGTARSQPTRRRPRACSTPPTAPSSTGSGSGTAISLRRRACERLAAISTPGTASPSSPTASRI